MDTPPSGGVVCFKDIIIFMPNYTFIYAYLQSKLSVLCASIYVYSNSIHEWRRGRMDILDRIKQLRDERGWSNYKLAKEAHISEGSLNNLFRLNNQPTIPTLEAICAGLGISLSQFFAEGNEAIVLNDEQKEMLNIWSTLNKERKAALLELLKKM